MRGFWGWLLRVSHSNSEAQRRGQNVIILALGLIGMGLLSVPLVLIQPDPLPQLLPSLAGNLLSLGLIALARRGQVQAAALGLVGLLVVSLFSIPLVSRQVGLVPSFMVLGVLVASVTAGPRAVALTTLAALVALAAQGALLAEAPQRLAPAPEVLAVGVVVAVMGGLVGALGARSTSHALGEARRAREAAELAARALDRANRELEQRVIERTAALEQALAAAEEHAAAQARLLAENQTQRATIRALSTPVLPVSDSTLVLPLVGSLDDERILAVQEQALLALERSHARRLLLDVTGIQVVDSAVARGLLRIVQGARLLGAEAVLIGVAPEVAQAMVGLDIDTSLMRTERDLREALRREYY